MPLDTNTAAATGSDLRARVLQIIAATNGKLSQAEVARQAGIPASTLSQYLRDLYPGDVAKVEGALIRWLDTQAVTADVAELLPSLPPFVDTPTSRRITVGLQYAQSARNIVMVYGAAGVGKTRTIRQYRKTHSNVWMVTVDPMLAQLGALLDATATTLGVPDGRRDPASLRKAIITKLKGTGGLLVYDEAQHLTDKALEGVRAIHDAVNDGLDNDDVGVGVALVGNTVLYTRLRGQKRAHDFAQVTRRIGKYVRLDGPTNADIQAIAAAFRLEGPDELDAARQIASRPGALGLLEQVLKQAWLMAAGEAQSTRPTLAHVQAAFADLQRDGEL
jgi:DNA transposition AAA+ family ATPase